MIALWEWMSPLYQFYVDSVLEYLTALDKSVFGGFYPRYCITLGFGPFNQYFYRFMACYYTVAMCFFRYNKWINVGILSARGVRGSVIPPYDHYKLIIALCEYSV